MGTNIRMHLEEKVNGMWWDRNLYVLSSPVEINNVENKWSLLSVCTGRDYLLFSLLAGVRNYHLLEPISAPRGIPADCTPGIRKAVGDIYGDVHFSHSWLSVKELFSLVRGDDGRDIVYRENSTMGHAVESMKFLLADIENQLYLMGRTYGPEDLYSRSDDFRVVFWFEK